MHIRYFSVIAVLLLGISASVWYAKQEDAHQEAQETASGFVTASGTEGDLVVPAPELPTNPPTAAQTEAASAPSHKCETASLTIGATTYAPCGTGATLIEIMRGLASEGLTFSGKEHTGLGFFVEAINGVKAGAGQYWSLYKNGEYSEFGVSAAKVAPGDKFEWKLEKSY